MLVLLSVYTKDNGMGYQEELCMHKRLKWFSGSYVFMIHLIGTSAD